MSGVTRKNSQLPTSVHLSRPWLIHDIVPDFILEDVWAIPVYGDAHDFQDLLDAMDSLDITQAKSRPLRFLWWARDMLGKWFGIGRVSAASENRSKIPADTLFIPGTHETRLTYRLPNELRKTAANEPRGSTPFMPMYHTDTEYAAELSNKTAHAVMHLAWAAQENGHYQGQMAVYVKPRGLLGKAYIALIKPFWLWIVYPAFMREIEHAWKRQKSEKF